MGEAIGALSPRQEADDDVMAVARKLLEQAQALMATHERAKGERGGNISTKLPAKRRRKRRTKVEHAGVKLLEVSHRSGSDQTSWVARWKDPDSGAWCQVSLDGLGYTTDEGRRSWAVSKAQALTKRRQELAAGAVRHSKRDVRAAVQDYIDHSEKTKRPGTVEAMRPALARFVEWAEKRGIKTTDEVMKHDLAAFREDLAAATTLDPVKGAKRGARCVGGKRLSPVSINSYLKAIKACLNWLRRTGLLAHVPHHEDITEAMGAVQTSDEGPEFLTATQARAVLVACLAHDDARWSLTRDEHDGKCEAGSTPKHTAIAPFVAFLLGTGCRVGEALSLEWSEVDLDALDDAGRAVGAVTVTAAKSKTKKARVVGLEVCPGVRALLAAKRDALKAADRAPIGRVFSEHTESSIKRAIERLNRPAPGPGARQRAAGYGAPAFAWHTLRRTAGTHLVCAPSIYGGSALSAAAKQLGHSAVIAEKRYVGRVRGIPHGLTTLDEVLGISDALAEVTRRIGGAPALAPAARAVANG